MDLALRIDPYMAILAVQHCLWLYGRFEVTELSALKARAGGFPREMDSRIDRAARLRR